MILTSQKISIMLRDIQLEQSSESLVKKIQVIGFAFGLLSNLPIIIGLISIKFDKKWFYRVSSTYFAICIGIICLFLTFSTMQVFRRMKKVGLQAEKK